MLQRLTQLLAMSTLLILSACGQGPVLRIDEAHVRVSPVKDRPAVGYFTVKGGPEDVELRSVVSDRVIRIEMHETMEHDGMSMMRPVEAVKIPAEGEVKFEQGGKHIMIWGVPDSAVTLNELPLIFVFSNGDRIAFDATVEGPKAE